jgi:hypothetical protein
VIARFNPCRSVVPTGLAVCQSFRIPALKGWAILFRSLRDEEKDRAKHNTEHGSSNSKAQVWLAHSKAFGALC